MSWWWGNQDSKGIRRSWGLEHREELNHSRYLKNRATQIISMIMASWAEVSESLRTSESGCFPTVLENAINNLIIVSTGC